MSYFSNVSIFYHSLDGKELITTKKKKFLINKKIYVFTIISISILFLILIGGIIYQRKINSILITTTTKVRNKQLNNTNSSICQLPVLPLYNKTGTTVANITDAQGSVRQPLYSPLPISIYLDSKKDLYVVDKLNGRIIKYLSNNSQPGIILPISLYNPQCIYINHENDDIYVLNYDVNRNYQVKYISFNGSDFQIKPILTGSNAECFGMVLDDQLNIYISEYSEHQVTKWIAPNYKQYVIVAGDGTAGSEAYQLNQPQGLYLDRTNNNLYTVDINGIQLWPEGSNVGKTIMKNRAYGPRNIRRDCHGNFYIVAPSSIKLFNPSVDVTGLEGIVLLGIPNSYIQTTESSTIDDFADAVDIYLDQTNGDLYVLDSIRLYVRKYTLIDTV